jgi:hypothetical protein
MIRTIKNFAWFILNTLRIGGVIRAAWKGNYLHAKGWMRSYYESQAVDIDGRPIPWCSYPFISFIEPRLHRSMDIFEYGSGNSSKWYAARVHSITSVEHDVKWFEAVKEGMPENAVVILGKLGNEGNYASLISKQNTKYHAVIIDGRDRNSCARYCVGSLTDDGVIIFDNSQRTDYSDAMRHLEECGFRRIDFFGMTPIIPYENCTTIFYRSNNCLKI